MSPKVKEAVRGFLPTRLKAHRIRGGPLAGRSIYTSWHDYPGAIRGNTESPLLEWFARNVKAGETWIDVGAHYGYTGIALSNLVGVNGRVVAFEPVLATAACIARTRELNRLSQLQVVPLALGAQSGIHSRQLPVSRGMADSTLATGTWTERIFVAQFDELWTSLCGTNPTIHGVKVDVQGMEAAALAGMAETLRRFHPRLVIEFHAAVERREILDLLISCGYDPTPEPVEAAFRLILDNKSYAFQAQ